MESKRGEFKRKVTYISERDRPDVANSLARKLLFEHIKPINHLRPCILKCGGPDAVQFAEPPLLSGGEESRPD